VFRQHHILGYFRNFRLAKQSHEFLFNILTARIQDATSGNDDKVVIRFEASITQPECFTQKTLGPITVNRPTKSTLTGDNTKTKTFAAPIADPYHHEFPHDVGFLVKDLREIARKQETGGPRKRRLRLPRQWWRAGHVHRRSVRLGHYQTRTAFTATALQQLPPGDRSHTSPESDLPLTLLIRWLI
jgi:hypothetical protein